MGTVEGAIFALVMEKGNAAVWSLKLDTKLLAAVYSVTTFHIHIAFVVFLLKLICVGMTLTID